MRTRDSILVPRPRSRVITAPRNNHNFFLLSFQFDSMRRAISNPKSFGTAIFEPFFSLHTVQTKKKSFAFDEAKILWKLVIVLIV